LRHRTTSMVGMVCEIGEFYASSERVRVLVLWMVAAFSYQEYKHLHAAQRLSDLITTTTSTHQQSPDSNSQALSFESVELLVSHMANHLFRRVNVSRSTTSTTVTCQPKFKWFT